jgi:predicted ATPase/class 3 adenylate cyclase
MAELPTGTVTFLFTDIEGSTRLLQRLGVDRFEKVQDAHGEILRRAIEDGGGTVVRIEGDAFFAAFPTAAGALGAAVDAQRDLNAHPWPEDGVVRVRMGLHSGEGRLGGGDYVGLDPNRAARIAAAGHGGQVLISDATRALLDRDLPEGVTLRDLGRRRLKDLRDPERLFDLVVDGLPSEFPALKSLDARPGNLPPQLTTLVGREAEVALAIDLVHTHRLVTLTGAGGTGKTRLGLAVGAEVLPSFEDGVFLVELASLVEPGQVCPAICQVLGVAEERGRDLIDTLIDRLTGKELLLILDNFEHLLEAAWVLEQILRRVDRVRVLATSRAPLRLYGEQELEVPPLGLPEAAQDLATISGSEAVTLFVDRARELRPGFALTEENAGVVAEICRRLDGLPLAIELAARRISIMPPEAILSRLRQRLDLLTSGARNAPQRQRTLRGAIDWSYQLLDEPLRRLFACLSVFAGGADVDAVRVVCDPDRELEGGGLDALTALADNGLIRPVDHGSSEARFSMLETIREYAAERLDAEWDGNETRRRHADHFLALAEASEPGITAQDHAGLDRLDLERDNVQAALRWAIDSGQAERGMAAAAAIWRYWLFREQLGVGRDWLERLLAVPGDRTAVRARAHRAAGSLAYWQADLAATERHYADAVAIFEELDDRAGLAGALYDLAFVPYLRGSGYDDALRRLQAALELFEEVGDRKAAEKARGDIPYFMMLAGDLEDAVPLLEEALARARARGDIFEVMDNLFRVAEGRRLSGDVDGARTAALEALDIVDRADIEGGIAAVLQLLAWIEAADGRHRRALRLYGAYDALAEDEGGRSFPSLPEDPLEGSREALGAKATDHALDEGRAMTRADAVAYARSGEE